MGKAVMRENTKSGAGSIEQPSRREFLAGGAGLLLEAKVGSAIGLRSSADPGSTDRPVLHIIGHSHIDAAWLWPWRDSTCVVLTTFRSALDRMMETPGFRYSHSSTIHYRWVQQADPRMFEEIRQRIKEGRWEVVGGWPVEPDCNIPSTESFVRHCVYGKGFCSRFLGANVVIGFNPDSFGHAAGLPTVLRHAGYKYYVFMRPQEQEMTLPRLFWWEGPDGSRILTFRIYRSYDSSADRLREAVGHVFPDGCHHGAFLMGVGDHGGAVTKAQIQRVLALRQDPTLPELRWSTLQEFFTAVESTLDLRSVPVIKGDLQHHSRGCYSACGAQKFENRRTEHQLFLAESVAVIAKSFTGRRVEALSRFSEGWQRLLFNQFHDVLAGTSLYSNYQDVRDGIGYACQMAMESKVICLETLSRSVDLTHVPEGAVFAYNPLPWRRKTLLEYHCKEQELPYTHLKAQDGTAIPLQVRPSDSMSTFFPRHSSWVDLPACGYKVFTIESGSPPPAPKFSQMHQIASDSFGLKSLLAEDGTELLQGGMGLVVIEDPSDTWSHDVDSFSNEIGRPEFVSSEVVESGPVTRVTRQTLKWKNSVIRVDIAEFSAIDSIQFRFVIDWSEHQEILKLELPTCLAGSRVIAKVPGAAIERPSAGNEEPCQDWVAVEGSVGANQYTVGLINDRSYSYSSSHGQLRMILIRSAPYARHNPCPVELDGINAWQDQGRQERSFWLTRGSGSFTELSLDRLSWDLQTPAEYVLDSRHGGTEPWEKSFLEVSPSNVEVLAIKQAEDSSGLIVRMQERAGRATRAGLSSRPLGLNASVTLAPWEVKTVRIDRNGLKLATLRVISPLEPLA